MAQKPESRLVTKILKMLRSQGGWWLKVHGSPYQTAGVPDILGVYAGRFIAFEVKRPGLKDTLNSRQAYILGKIEKAGGIAVVVESDLEAYRVILTVNEQDKWPLLGTQAQPGTDSDSE